MISSVWRPTETAAYNEYEVSLYSCIIAGLALIREVFIMKSKKRTGSLVH